MPVTHSMYREAGKIEIDEASCGQCGLCAGICEIGVLTMDNGRVRVHDSPFGCIACGHCMMVCPTGSIKVSGRDILPADLLPLPPPERRATVDALAALMLSRRSVRHFSERKVNKETTERILEMAASAPMSIPPWDIGCVTVLGRENVHELASDIIRGYEGLLKVFRPWLLALMQPFYGRSTYEKFSNFILPLAKAYVTSHHDGKDALFWNAPAVMIFHHSPYTYFVDATIACTYAMLAAESLGLGSTIIGGAPPILQRNKALCRKIGIPAENKPAMALILGYPDANFNFRQGIRRRFSHVNVFGN